MPLVSVWITTYNHEAYISEAIESILSQKVDFDYEIIIGEDYSTDQTRKIVKQYKEKFPDKIRLYLPKKNLGMIPMFKESYSLCTGKYIAWLDGDDYWTDPNKLQIQVDLLESHPEYSFCFHKVTLLNQGSNTCTDSSPPQLMNNDSVLSDKHFLHIHNPVDTPSVVHRNVLGKALPTWFFQLPFPDWGFYFLLLQHGKAKYIHKNMSIYRIHKGGAWSGQSERKNYISMIQFFMILKSNLDYLSQQKINQLISYFHFKVLILDLKNGTFHDFFQSLRKLLLFDRRQIFNNIKPISKLFLKKIFLLHRKY